MTNTSGVENRLEINWVLICQVPLSGVGSTSAPDKGEKDSWNSEIRESKSARPIDTLWSLVAH